jgi:hypothetical protein
MKLVKESKKTKFGSIMNDIHKSEEIPISNFDILKLTNNKTKIVMYEDLMTMYVSQFIDLFQKETNYNIILLYQITAGYGHWISIILDKEDTGEFYHFDSYGLYPDNMLDKIYPYKDLSRLYQESGIKVNVSTYKFQEKIENINTCGRWAALRSNYYYMTNNEFINYFTSNKISQLVRNLDDVATIMTMIPLDYVQETHEMIDKQM